MLSSFVRLGTLLCMSVALLYSLPADAFSIRPNCDLRTLKLTPAQKARLQAMRQHYKTENDRILREVFRHRNRVNLSHVFEKPTFDNEFARRIAQERYADEMAQTIEELRFYHSMYHILTPQQQRIWLQLCVRH